MAFYYFYCHRDFIENVHQLIFVEISTQYATGYFTKMGYLVDSSSHNML